VFGTHWTIQSCTPGFVEFFCKLQNLSIISIRGTPTELDFVGNIGLFMDIALQQVLMMSNILPTKMVQTFVNLTSFNDPPGYFQHFHKVLDHIDSSVKSRNVVFTGHSLGGAFAQVLGQRMGLPSVVFSSPGVYYTSTKFGISDERKLANVVNVIPRQDAVTWLDEQAGTVVKIDCMRTVTECHKLRLILCALWHNCRNGRSLNCSKFLP